MKLLDKIRVHADKVTQWAQSTISMDNKDIGACLGVASVMAALAISTVASPIAIPALMAGTGALSAAMLGLAHKLLSAPIKPIDPNKVSTERIARYAGVMAQAGNESAQQYLKNIVNQMTPERLQSFVSDLANVSSNSANLVPFVNARHLIAQTEPKIAVMFDQVGAGANNIRMLEPERSLSM